MIIFMDIIFVAGVIVGIIVGCQCLLWCHRDPSWLCGLRSCFPVVSGSNPTSTLGHSLCHVSCFLAVLQVPPTVQSHAVTAKLIFMILYVCMPVMENLTPGPPLTVTRIKKMDRLLCIDNKGLSKYLWSTLPRHYTASKCTHESLLNY